MKRWLHMVVAVVALVLVIGGVKAVSVFETLQGFKAKGEPQFTVSAAKAELSPWQPTLSSVASLHAVHGADLSPEVAGIVDLIAFESGQDVKPGQLLVRLRAADDLARLESLRATAALNQSVYTRDQAQFEAQALSQATLDSDAANMKAAQALVDEQQAITEKKFIRAPFAGRIGIRAVDAGQYVSPGTKLATLQSLDPIFADFYLPQQAVAQIAVGQTVTLTSAAGSQPVVGRIDAINPQVDTNTRNVQIRAQLANPERKLLPGMFVDVSVAVSAPQQYLTLPQSALTYNPYGASVYVIKSSSATAADSKQQSANPPGSNTAAILRVQQQFVESGPTRGDQVAILRGLQSGDLVVTSGQLKLKNGAAVVIDNSVTPANNAHPTPVNE